MSDDHFQYLDQKLEQYDRDFLLTRNFARPGDRLLLSALHTLRAELRAIPGAVRDTGVALNKINWWQTEWQRLAEQRARHPVTMILQQLLRQQPPSLADATLALAQTCVEDSCWESVTDLVSFAERTAAPFAALEMACGGLKTPGPGLQRAWRDIELVATVVELRRSPRGGSRAIPQDWIEETQELLGHGYSGCGPCHAHIYREVQKSRLHWMQRNPGSRREYPALRRLWSAWRGSRFARRAAANGEHP